MNFFDALLHPDRDEDPDRAQIVHAANLLEIGEFQFLQLAFAEWYGREMNETEREAFFGSFFLRGNTPLFLRHYARKIVASEQEGTLWPGRPEYHRYDCEAFQTRVPKGLRHFLAITALLVGVLMGSLAMASYTVEYGGRCTSNLPPCFTDRDLDQSLDR